MSETHDPQQVAMLKQLLHEERAARAAEATQHQQEIAAKDETILQLAEDVAYFKDFRDSVAAALCVENEQGPVDSNVIVEAADSSMSQLFDFSARIAAVEAERDKAVDENIRLTNAEIEALRAERGELWGSNHLNANALRLCQAERDAQYTQAVEATQRALLAEQALANTEAKLDALRVHCEHCGADYAATGMEAGCPCAVRAERDRLKAALSTAAFALDLAGFRRDRDAAYAALTPQGQSTDGETR